MQWFLSLIFCSAFMPSEYHTASHCRFPFWRILRSIRCLSYCNAWIQQSYWMHQIFQCHVFPAANTGCYHSSWLQNQGFCSSGGLHTKQTSWEARIAAPPELLVLFHRLFFLLPKPRPKIGILASSTFLSPCTEHADWLATALNSVRWPLTTINESFCSCKPSHEFTPVVTWN